MVFGVQGLGLWVYGVCGFKVCQSLGVGGCDRLGLEV